MKQVFVRVHNFGDIKIASTSKYFPIDECHMIFNQFCNENKFVGTFVKGTQTFSGDVIIHCRLSIDDLRDFKIKQIII
jgi:hypothetical protein